MIENIVIGKPIVDESLLLGENRTDKSWKKETVYTEERFLPKILREFNFVESTSWVRKNKPNLWRELNDLDFIELKITKKSKPIWIVVGE